MLAHTLLAYLLCTLLVACAGGGARAAGTEAQIRPDQRALARTLVYDCNQNHEVFAQRFGRCVHPSTPLAKSVPRSVSPRHWRSRG